MLRSTRLLLLLAIVLILGAVGATYYRQRAALSRQAPPPPKSLPLDTAATASSWVYTKYDGQRLVAEVRAKDFRQLNEPSRLELDQVELRLIKPDGKRYDWIRSAKAQLDQAHDTLYSDGEVEITMGVPLEGPSRGRLLAIRSSGVSFDVKTGRATTSRQASFTFDLGDGQAVGAIYDPNLRELIMQSQIELHWRGAASRAKPMKLEAGDLIYRERDSVVLLNNWARLTRENTELNASGAVVTLKDGMIQKVDAQQARGAGRFPNRQLDYAADGLIMNFNADGEVEKITGDRNARLVSTSEATRTTITADRVDLDFAIVDGESTLSKALTTGHSLLESVPVPRQGVSPPESRLLRSEVILLTMRPGGREIAGVETHTPGHLEFLPNSPGQRHRTLDAERIQVAYGPANQIRSFGAYKAATHTDPEPRPPNDKRPPGAPVQTWSDDLAASFDPKTGQLARLEQWTNFRYQEGDRKASAHRAVLEEARNLISLEQAARVWDASGSTAADHILLDQKSGDVLAEGHVVSTRLPDQNGKSSSMLSHDEPLNATAGRMQTSERNRKIHYEGQTVAWQGANRIWADSLDIDRAGRRLSARGHVRTQFLDQPKDSPGKSRAAPAFANVESAALVYTEADRLAHYAGGAHLTRAGMDVKASEIRAYLNESGADSSLDRAYADGRVAILQPARNLTGTSEHAEYYAADQKVILSGGDPTLVDSVRGSTKGRVLTYWANDDKLLVNGTEKEPVKTRIKRR
ncbi:MAG: LPS export ABC transporter periplasmic protein LptC [Bryobacteraceae bacterium]|jgi:lipopolysaccharide export system protein LptA